MLKKDPYTLKENSGLLTSLTENGREECFQAGQQLRQRYVDNTTATHLPGIADFSLSTVLVSAFCEALF